jgi:transposase
MTRSASRLRRQATAAPTRLPFGAQFADESLYVGIDVGKSRHVAGFVSRTLLERHGRFEGCPALVFDNSREGFRTLVERIEAYTPREQVAILVEKTGHYHDVLLQYLLELDLSVYLIHVQERQAGLLKTDKRDALSLANTLYNQLELGAQVQDKAQLVRRAVPPTEAAALLRGLVRHRYELVQEATQRKNKLTAICDQLFPEFTQVFKNPNAEAALAIRDRFPTPQHLATASQAELQALRTGHHLPTDKLERLQQAAITSIGLRQPGRQRGLLLEQRQLIAELQLLQEHIADLDREIAAILGRAREGQILLSIPVIGPIQAASIIAAIGHIDNFPSAGALRAYFGWAPRMRRSGSTLDQAKLTRGGTRTMKQLLYLIVGNAVQNPDCEWARIYERLVPIKCSYDERKQEYVGKNKVMARIAGQITSTIYALLKYDAETLARHAAGRPLPAPMLYDPAVHRAHREGQYRSLKPKRLPVRMTVLQSP